MLGKGVAGYFDDKYGRWRKLGHIGVLHLNKILSWFFNPLQAIITLHQYVHACTC